MASKKVTVTIPEELLEELRAETAERGISSYVAEAVRAKLDRDRLRELVDWLEEEHGPVTEVERAAAYDELADLDAQHEQRQAARSTPAAKKPTRRRRSRSGEAA